MPITTSGKVYQSQNSAQPCGCDRGANHWCELHFNDAYPRGGPQDPTGYVVKDSSTRQESLGIGGAPTRATVLPTDGAARKQFPIASGVLDYFPDALAVIANVSWQGNEQHNPGQILHWAREKSGDEADTMIRHFLQRGSLDTDGIRHSAKMAWRALAILQKELEQEKK